MLGHAIRHSQPGRALTSNRHCYALPAPLRRVPDSRSLSGASRAKPPIAKSEEPLWQPGHRFAQPGYAFFLLPASYFRLLISDFEPGC